MEFNLEHFKNLERGVWVILEKIDGETIVKGVCTKYETAKSYVEEYPNRSIQGPVDVLDIFGGLDLPPTPRPMPTPTPRYDPIMPVAPPQPTNPFLDPVPRLPDFRPVPTAPPFPQLYPIGSAPSAPPHPEFGTIHGQETTSSLYPTPPVPKYQFGSGRQEQEPEQAPPQNPENNHPAYYLAHD